MQQTAAEGLTRQFTMVGSSFWFSKFAEIEQFDATSHADVLDEDE
ncbi:hypothetical protein ACRWQL_13195 [Shewanella sp. HL-SH4]